MSGDICKTIESRVDILEHDIYDNGGIGMKTMVNNHENLVQRMKGVSWLMGFVGITNIVTIILYFTR